MNSHRLCRVVLLAMLLLGAFGLGQRYSAPVSAQARQKWEYRLVKLGGMERNTDDTFDVRVLGRIADEGWEAVGMNDSWVLLKRSK